MEMEMVLPLSPPVSPLNSTMEEDNIINMNGNHSAQNNEQQRDEENFFSQESFQMYSISSISKTPSKLDELLNSTTRESVATQTVQPSMRSSNLSREEHISYLKLQNKIQDFKMGPRDRSPFQVLPISPEEVALFNQLNIRAKQEQEEFKKGQYLESITVNKELYLSVPSQIEEQLKVVYQKKKEQLLTKYPRFYDICTAFDLKSIIVSSDDPILQHKQTVCQKGACLMFKPPTSPSIPLDKNYYSFEDPNPNQPYDYWTKKRIPLISEDPIVKSILANHRIDIVVSSSTLRAIVGTIEPFEDFWEIPALIQNFQGNKIVFIDKPLLKKKMTSRDKLNEFYDVAFQASVFQPLQEKYIDLEENVWKSPQSTKETGEKTPNLLYFLKEDNLNYNIWQFGKLKILIRCKIHGFISNPQNPRDVRYIGIKTKLHYQAKHGREETLLKETAKWWIYTFLRPDAHLMLGHISVSDSTIIDIEQKDMLKILSPGCLFKPEKSSKLLFTIFQKLVNLEAGNYLISHKKTESNVVIYESINTSQQSSVKGIVYYDLHEAHANSPQLDSETIPYIPFFFTNKPDQIPYTFPINPQAITQPFKKEYCFKFLENGVCNNPNCFYIHDKPSSFVKYCFAFAKTGQCPDPNCKYVHIPKKKVVGKKKKKKKKKSKKD